MLHLGKKDKTHDGRDWLWEDFRVGLKRAGLLPTSVPAHFGHGNTYKDWKMLANGPDPTAPGEAKNGAGCCVYSSAAHETMESLTDAGQSLAGTAALFDGATTIADYAARTGYDPQTGEHDEGEEIRAALLYRQQTGIVDASGKRHKIGPFVSLEPGNLQHLLEAIYFFEGLPIGVVLQQAQMDQFNRAEERGTTPVWSYVKGSPDIGGHCVPEVGRPDSEHITALSWAKRLLLTMGLLGHQCDEVWAYTTPERISKATNKTYEGANQAQLEEFLHTVGKAGGRLAL